MRITVLLFVALAGSCAPFSACVASTYTMVDLGGAEMTSTAFGINADGTVVGKADYYAVLWDTAGGVRDLGWPAGSRAYGVNSAGIVVGAAASPTPGDRRTYAFAWSQETGGSLITDCPGAAYAVNNSGLVVGHAADDTYTTSRPFMWSSAIGLHYIGESYGTAYGVDDAERVVGGMTCSGQRRAFLWDVAGGIRDLGTLGGSEAEARAANGGRVVGWAHGGDGLVHAFIWDSADGMRPLGTLPGWRHSYAYGINSLGQVVGVAESPEGLLRACLWRNTGEMLVLDTSFSTACGINDLGVIVGQSGNRAVMWVPVPEPSSLLALTGGIAGLGGLALRRKRGRVRVI